MKKFIGEEIEVLFDKEFVLEKKPPCPDRILWDGEEIIVQTLISSWTDFERKGKLSRNMREKHLARANIKGSWGSGRFFFRVRDTRNRIMTIYYDRAVKKGSDKKGSWHLLTIGQ